MAKKIQVLGMSKYVTCLVFDILKDNGIADHIDIYLNIDMNPELEMPVTKFPHSVYSKDVAPNPDVHSVFGASRPKNKFAIFHYFRDRYGLDSVVYENIIHYSSHLSRSSKIANGGFLEQQVVVSSQTIIGFGVTIKRGALIGHHCNIGNFVDINPGCVISGNVTIGKGVIIGTGTKIIDGISIGENSFIGAGSVVVKDIPPGVVAFGNPCRVIRKNSSWEI